MPLGRVQILSPLAAASDPSLRWLQGERAGPGVDMLDRAGGRGRLYRDLVERISDVICAVRPNGKPARISPEETQRHIAPQTLTCWGYRVEAVDSGESALGHLQPHSAERVLLDMILTPGVDGLETLHTAARPEGAVGQQFLENGCLGAVPDGGVRGGAADRRYPQPASKSSAPPRSEERRAPGRPPAGSPDGCPGRRR